MKNNSLTKLGEKIETEIIYILDLEPYPEFARKLGRNLRDMDHSVKLQQREYGRKLQDVNCLLAAVDGEQKKLCENKLHLENQEEIEENEQSVQVC